MKNFKLDCLFAIIGLLLVFSGCQKDEPLNQPSQNESSKNLFKTIPTWSNAEKHFFSLKDPSTTGSRKIQPVIMYNPLLILSYNHLVIENESRNFVDEISSKVGFPNWEKSAIFYNKIDKSNAVFVPLIKNSASNVNGIISFNIINGKMVTNGYLRSNVEHSLQKDKRNYFIAKHFANFDKEIYGISPTPAFLEYLCECENSDPTVLNPNDCEWQLVKLCKDSGANVGWVDGQKPIYPIHLDHDADGVPNDDDQDWFDWSTRHNVSQEEFEKRVRDSWNQNQFDEYGDYDLFWEEFDDFITDQWDQYDEEDPGGGSLNFDWIFDIFDFFSDFFGSIINWFEDRFDDFWEWIDFWDDVHCPWDDINSSLLENRTISCDWYYIKNCEGNNIYQNWWENFDISLECDIIDHMQSDVAEKLQKYLNSPTTINPCSGLPLNKVSFAGQLCDNYGYLINDQEFLEGGAITPEIELVLRFDFFKSLGLSGEEINTILCTGQVPKFSMKPIDMETATCEQITNQLLTAIRGSAYVMTCMGGSPIINLKDFFTNFRPNNVACSNINVKIAKQAPFNVSFNWDFLISNYGGINSGFIELDYYKTSPNLNPNVVSFNFDDPNNFNIYLLVLNTQTSKDAENLEKFINPKCN